MNQTESNKKMIELMNKQEDILYKEEIQLFKKLMFQCDLKQQDNIGKTLLFLVLVNNKTQNLKFKKKHFQTMCDASNKKQKQTNFQKFIQANHNNNYQYPYLEEINLLLYDCKFKTDKKTIYWLKKINIKIF